MRWPSVSGPGDRWTSVVDGPLRVSWPGTPDPSQPAVDARIAQRVRELPVLTTPQAARELREQGISVFPIHPPSPRAFDTDIPGPAGSLRVRVIQPTGPTRGVYLHVHGGGWVLGRPHHMDYQNERLAEATGLVVVSPYYRLAPEDPYPAGPDDVEATALWLIDKASEKWGTATFFIGGESAGGHLAALTLLRLRDRHGSMPFRAANLVYGMFDLRLTPSARSFGDPPVTLGQTALEWMLGHFLGSTDAFDPAVSPLLAGLDGLCPALFTVGTRDPLLDDSLFMATRWAAAGNRAELVVQPGGHHAFDYYDDPPGLAARRAMYEFLGSFLA